MFRSVSIPLLTFMLGYTGYTKTYVTFMFLKENDKKEFLPVMYFVEQPKG